MASMVHVIYSDIFKGCALASGASFGWYIERFKRVQEHYGEEVISTDKTRAVYQTNFGITL